MNLSDFKKIQSELDAHGVLTEIQKVGKKEYNLIINFTVVKIRKQRRSCKAYVIRLYDKTKLQWN